ncbi:MAG: bifunctional diaminohydroxyphosphoribosylaminopyrimidine deaminase/5-amino-6-(5-phosphoribosylamino)uracil reductase RibD [Planctomycetia bacterium]|nr:bifunctional diaminohydroxyphosphoribosylaminopyrimidine deaminase/5-amino-6-(5-phosphoribosylamino)uracil reductase RibD [Planctomycetia bacterium]
MLKIPARNKIDEHWMLRALKLARRGQGYVEPNPMVGCVIVADGGTGEMVGEGFHEKFGEAHAEINALKAAGEAARGATVYVTLEPCCHYGKTPPCTEALIQAGVKDVVVAMRDPFPKVAGGGIRRLREAGIPVQVGLCEEEARELNAPYLKLMEQKRPWVIAKYAMTLDGKIATRAHSSRWISSPASRAKVHQLRARVDAIMVGAATAIQDDPMLTARCEDFASVSQDTMPEEMMLHRTMEGIFSGRLGEVLEQIPEAQTDVQSGVRRVPVRIVADAKLKIPVTSQLVKTAVEFPTLLLVGPEVSSDQMEPYLACGCEIFQAKTMDRAEQIGELLDELGRRKITNLLVEGGGGLLGVFFDLREIDEMEVFVAPKLVGGRNAITPIAGIGTAAMEHAVKLRNPQVEILDGDIHVHARVQKNDRMQDMPAPDET